MKIEIWLATSKIGSKVKKIIRIPDRDWEAMSDFDQENRIYDEILNRSMFKWGYSMIKDG